MSSARAESLERQATLHEREAAAIREQVRAARDREALATQLAVEKRQEAGTVHGHPDETRLFTGAEICEREAHVFAKEAESLEAEGNRALAQAATARQKAALDGVTTP